MKMQLCVVKDNAVQAFLTPIFLPHVGAFVRAFSDQVNDSGTDFHKHPADYEAYHIGEYDDQTGLVTPFESPVRLARALDLILSKN